MRVFGGSNSEGFLYRSRRVEMCRTQLIGDRIVVGRGERTCTDLRDCPRLAGDGVSTRVLQAYLGHRNTQNTTRYTALAPGRLQRILARLIPQRSHRLRLFLFFGLGFQASFPNAASAALAKERP